MREPHCVKGGLDGRFLRVYKELEYAEQFVDFGRVRLGRLDLYKSMEDESRRDEREGEASLRIPGEIKKLHVDAATMEQVGETVEPGLLNYWASYHNPVYLFCVSEANVGVDAARAMFGEHVVEISDGRMLFEDVVSASRDILVDDREILFIDGCPVRYDKGEIGTVDDTRDLRTKYAQKPRDPFEREREHRVALGLSGAVPDAPEGLFLQLSRFQSYTKLI